MKVIRTTIAVIAVLVFAMSLFADNTKTGTQAGTSLSSKSADNVLDGFRSGFQQVTGKGNTLIGAYAGYMGYDYMGTTKLGYMAGYGDTLSHKLFITTGYYPARGIFGDFSTGYFGINKASPTCALDVTGNAVLSGTLTTGSTGYFYGLSTTNTGTAALPSIGYYDDVDTGIYFPTAHGNQVAISAKGNQVALFDSSGMQIRGKTIILQTNSTESIMLSLQDSTGVQKAWIDSEGVYHTASGSTSGTALSSPMWMLDLPTATRNYAITGNDSGTVVAASDTSMTMTAYESYLQFSGNGSSLADTVQVTRTFVPSAVQAEMDTVYWYENTTSASADSAGLSLVIRNKNGTTHTIVASDSMHAPATANTWTRRAKPLAQYFSVGTRYSAILTAKMTASQRVNVSPLYLSSADPILLNLALSRPDTMLGPELITSNSTFTSWTGTDSLTWLPTGYSAYGTTSADNYRINATNAAKLVTTGSGLIGFDKSSILTPGKTYRMKVDIVGAGVGKLTLLAGNVGIASALNPSGTLSMTYQSDGSRSLIYAGGTSTPSNITFTNYSVKEFYIVDASVYGRRCYPYVQNDGWYTLPSGISVRRFGLSSFDRVDCGVNFVPTGDITFEAKICPFDSGIGGAGRIASNGKFGVYLDGATRSIRVTRDSTTYATSADSVWAPNQWVWVTATSTATGSTNIYINNVLSGSADQSAGTPAAPPSATHFLIGNRPTVDRTFRGYIGGVRVYSTVLSTTYRTTVYNDESYIYGL